MMKTAYWGYWIMILGVFVFVVMMFTQTSTTYNTQDYYEIKEVTEAALYESVDKAHYRNYDGELKINKEKFVANFLKRFAETASLNSTYTVNFYELYEIPPKVTIEIKSSGGSFFIANSNTEAYQTTRMTAIIESIEGTGIEDNIKCSWE